jgi:N utilization substance protein A
VIVDDTQLSLAIGKKGQNVRLAAKLLGWKIDIKSEEEKRQEVESAMAALVPAGAPVSVLIDLGLAEKIVEKLFESSVGTVEKLGSMTPEELEAIPGIGPTVVEKILVAVNAYYAQFEPGAEAGGAEAGGAEAGAEAVLAPSEELAESQEGGVGAAESEASAEPSETEETASVAAGNAAEEKKEFDTIENSEGVG